MAVRLCSYPLRQLSTWCIALADPSYLVPGLPESTGCTSVTFRRISLSPLCAFCVPIVCRACPPSNPPPRLMCAHPVSTTINTTTNKLHMLKTMHLKPSYVLGGQVVALDGAYYAAVEHFLTCGWAAPAPPPPHHFFPAIAAAHPGRPHPTSNLSIFL